MKETLAALAMTSLTLATVISAPHAGADPTGISDTDSVLPRFVNDIWPAVEHLRGDDISRNALSQFAAIQDPTLSDEGNMNLIGATNTLGRASHYSGGTVEISYPIGDLTLTSNVLTALMGPEATVAVCYTYTSQRAVSKVESPSVSRANFHLHKTDAWYLNAITDDHPVTNCNTTTP